MKLTYKAVTKNKDINDPTHYIFLREFGRDPTHALLHIMSPWCPWRHCLHFNTCHIILPSTLLYNMGTA